MEAVTLKWMHAVINLNGQDSSLMAQKKTAFIKNWERDLQMRILSRFVIMRTKEMFSIFREFPDTLESINDFKYALDKTNMQKQFAA